jgi:hypothetical protein
VRQMLFISALLCIGCNLFLNDWDKIYDAGIPDAGVVDCGILYPPFNGSVDISNGTTYNKTAFYRCNDGYILSGAAERLCAVDGAWTEAPPTCLSMSVNIIETWYEGSETCDEEATLGFMGLGGRDEVDIMVNQIRPGEAGVGSCSGHTPVVTLIGSDRIDIVFESGGAVCYTACWDFTVALSIPDLPEGTYTVTVGTLTGEVRY